MHAWECVRACGLAVVSWVFHVGWLLCFEYCKVRDELWDFCPSRHSACWEGSVCDPWSMCEIVNMTLCVSQVLDLVCYLFPLVQ